MFSYSLNIAIAYCLMRRQKTWWEGMKMLEIFAYLTVAVVHFIDQNWIPKTVYFIRCVMVCKIGFTNWNTKIALLRASMVVTYYIKIFHTGADRNNGVLMSLLLLIAEKINVYTTFTEITLHIFQVCLLIFNRWVFYYRVHSEKYFIWSVKYSGFYIIITFSSCNALSIKRQKTHKNKACR